MRRAPLERGKPLETRTPLSRYTGLQPGPWSHAVPLLDGTSAAQRITASRAGISPAAERAGRRQGKNMAARKGATGFSPAVKLLVCTRAGHGDPDLAMCEACGIWVGQRQGDHQHIVARGMGGCKRAVTGSAANCALLCRRCHDLCEARDPHMEAAGFWARQGTDPRLLPMMLASEGGSGVMVWRSMDGGYLFEAPEVAA